MKYLVVVNQKYIVSVESTSAGGAEHVVLDRMGGIEGAQAFGPDGIKTDLFGHYLLTCETTSLDQLAKKAEAYDMGWQKYNLALDKVAELTRQISELTSELTYAQSNVRCCQDEVILAQREMGIGRKPSFDEIEKERLSK